MAQGFTVPGILDNAVTNAKIRDSVATSVIGRSANSSGDPADIAATADGQILQRSGSALVWATGGALIGRYDPDRTPTSGLDSSSSDEFIGSINTGIQTWGNQGTATITAELDTMRLHTAASASRDRKCLFYTLPSGDWVMTTKVSGTAFDSWRTNLACGIIVLETGSIATPTSISMSLVFRDTATTQAFGFYTSTSYTAAYTIVGTLNTMPDSWIIGGPLWLQARYVSSSKTLSAWGSTDGFNFAQMGSNRVLGVAPLNPGVFVDQNTSNVANDIRFHYLRTRTDATGTSSPYPVGS